LLLTENIKNIVKELIYRAQIELPEDVYRKLLEIYNSYKISDTCRKVLECIIENIKLARELRRPICQDTGTHIFFIRGSKICIDNKFIDILKRAVEEATREIPLRPNAVDVLTNRNTGTGVGKGIPDVEIFIEDFENNIIEITYIPKGGGCELPCRAFTVPPTLGFKFLKKAVVKLVKSLGRYACPPLTLGVGIGATISIAVKNAMKALYLREIDTRSEDEKIAKIEEELIELCNKTNIGIQGLGEGPTVLDVHLEVSCRHPATFSIAIVTSCWALRRAKTSIVL